MEKARRSGRIAKQVAIVLLGTDTLGKVFAEETKTVVLSRHGAGIVSRYRFAPDEVLTLRLAGSSREAEVRLVGQIGGEPDRYVYGVAFADSKLDFWQMEFPPPDSYQPDSRLVVLECSLCHERQDVQPRDIEADVYSINQSILRPCARCGTATVWKQAEGHVVSGKKMAESLRSGTGTLPDRAAGQYSPDLTTSVLHMAEPVGGPVAVIEAGKPEADSVVWPQKLPSPSPETPAPVRRVNRRRDVRARVTFMVCVRQGISLDDVVECENVSIGGLCFCSLRRYEQGSLIEVALPYSPGSPAVFVPACIKHVQELPGGRIFRYGVAYAKPSSAQPNL